MSTYMVLGHRVTPLHTVGDYALIEVVSAPQVPGPPPHLHEEASEFFYISEGSLEITVDSETRTLQQGESLCLRPGQVHTFINTTDRDVRWITGWSPRGFEQFFEDFGVAVEEPEALQKSVAEELIQDVILRCEKYGMTIATKSGPA